MELVSRKEDLARKRVCLADISEEVKVITDDKLEQVRRSALRQANHGHRVRLHNLLTEAGRPIPVNIQAAATSSLSILKSCLVTNLTIDPGEDTLQTPTLTRTGPRTPPVITSTPTRSASQRPAILESPVQPTQGDRERRDSGVESIISEEFEGGISHHRGNNKRKFIKRSKFRNKTRNITRRKVCLWSNYSSHVLTKSQAQYLDLGLNFVPLP